MKRALFLLVAVLAVAPFAYRGNGCARRKQTAEMEEIVKPTVYAWTPGRFGTASKKAQ